MAKVNYTPKYAIINSNDELVDTKKTLDDAKEFVKGTDYRIYNMDTRSYESVSDEFDKFALKNEIITIADELDKLGGALMGPKCADSETGMIRARVYTAMSKLHDELKKIIYQIY